MMYSTFSVRDAVKTACPELVDTIYRRAPYKSKEAFDEIYDHWQHIYDTGEQWAKEPIAPSVPLTIKRSPDSDLTAQKAISNHRRMRQRTFCSIPAYYVHGHAGKYRSRRCCHGKHFRDG